MNSRGEHAREEILNEAMRIASVDGLDGLSLGGLAKALGRSKSGLFAHFVSKEALQLEVLETAAVNFADMVVRPALREARGMSRLHALYRNWGHWGRESEKLPGGCVFVSASVELDDKKGVVRDRLVELQREWLEVLARVIETCVQTGELRDDTDPEQLAFEIYSMMLGSHHYHRLLGEKKVRARLRTALARILQQAQP